MLGDSYVQGNATGTADNAYTLVAKNNDYVYNMMGIGGNTAAEYTGLSSDRPAMVVRYANIPKSNIIGIEGGRNDYNNSIPIGTDSDFVSTTFKGALNIICKGLKDNNPNAIIFGVPCWKVTSVPKNKAGFNQVDYWQAFNDIVNKKYGYPVLDVTKVGVNMDDATFRKNYCESNYDVSHLNKQGMLNYLPYLQSFISKVAK